MLLLMCSRLGDALSTPPSHLTDWSSDWEVGRSLSGCTATYEDIDTALSRSYSRGDHQSEH